MKSRDSILAKQLEIAECTLQLLEPGLDVVEPLLTDARERVSGERSALPTMEELRAALRALDYVVTELEEASRLIASLRAANEEMRGVVDSVLRDEFEQFGGTR